MAAWHSKKDGQGLIINKVYSTTRRKTHEYYNYKRDRV